VWLKRAPCAHSFHFFLLTPARSHAGCLCNYPLHTSLLEPPILGSTWYGLLYIIVDKSFHFPFTCTALRHPRQCSRHCLNFFSTIHNTSRVNFFPSSSPQAAPTHPPAPGVVGPLTRKLTRVERTRSTRTCCTQVKNTGGGSILG
jgi:hypothetical protein